MHAVICISTWSQSKFTHRKTTIFIGFLQWRGEKQYAIKKLSHLTSDISCLGTAPALLTACSTVTYLSIRSPISDTYVEQWEKNRSNGIDDEDLGTRTLE